ncbi:MAG: FKBP-type peptidyl-prolyl cis-trans isomerase [Bacteroidales bacterium]|jgi:FKBP-type peptidyl-prolyl cis-trans isomerase|nr:FKBP-type peptidyl-prolyl cis-trans isomerase [Bacteroidales bacterium]
MAKNKISTMSCKDYTFLILGFSFRERSSLAKLALQRRQFIGWLLNILFKYSFLFIFLFLLFLTFSCKNNKKKTEKVKNNIADTAKLENFNYIIDSVSNNVAVLIIGEDGKSEYVINQQDKIFQKTKTGLEYRYIISGKGKKYPIPGNVITVEMTYKTEKDSLIFDTKNVSDIFKMKLTTASHKGGCIEEAFGMLTEGDSAIFKIDAANFFHFSQKKVNLPNFIKKDDKLIFNIKMKKIEIIDEFVKNNAEIYKFNIEQEQNLIEQFIQTINKPRKKLNSGLSIISIEKGSGKKVKSGNEVTIDYTASFIDGRVFDSTIERNDPFSFVVGKKEVIEGLEQGVQEMKVGDHAILVIPFSLAYGDTKTGIIPPFTTLVFEIKILNAK